MGPTWDYDGAFGYSTTEFRGSNPEIDFTIKYAWYNNYMTALYKYPQFAKKVKEIYENKEGFLTTNRDIPRNCFGIIVYIEYKKDEGSYFSRLGLCPQCE